MVELQFLYITCEGREGNNQDDGERCKSGSCTFRFTLMDGERKVLQIFTQAGGSCVGSLSLVMPLANGDICFLTTRLFRSDRAYICNLDTHELVTLPEGSPSNKVFSYGFGCVSAISPTSEENKLVRLFRRQDHRNIRTYLSDHWEIGCEIYSWPAYGPGLGGCQGRNFPSSWRVIDDKCPYPVEDTVHPACLNGCVHWVASWVCHSAFSRNEIIICLDLRTERFRILPHPSDYEHSFRSLVSVVDFGGKLSFVDFNDDQDFIFKTWTLKDYENCVWERSFNIDLKPIVDISFPSAFVDIPWRMVNGELLMVPYHARRLEYYNIETNNFRSIEMPEHKGEVCIIIPVRCLVATC